MSDPNDEELLARARAILDESAAGLDERTVRRLRIARERAVAGRGRGRSVRAVRWLAPAAAVAAGILGIVLSRGGRDEVLPEALEDIEILAASDQLELYDDVDFYAWLADEEERG